MDFYGFYTGKIFDAYKYLGAHTEKQGVTFRTFAPSASRITLIGEFNDWQEWDMNKVSDGNFWECYVPKAKAGQMYKYRIYDRSGNAVDHCDPYGFGMELRPNSASIIRDMNKYKFKDSQWMQNRSDCRKKPLNIYEIHFGSFRKPSDKADDWYNYEEMIDILIPYLTKNGYNYLEIMPLNEYPCDESWGYQATGFFSPTSRYGTADQLKAFVDACHKHGIGVLMDFVPVHFAVDSYGLANYDGTSLFEYPNSAVGVSEWGSCNFMHSRGEIRCFLQSAADYWLRTFHADGLRMDAVSRLIYWQGDPARGVNGSTLEFLKNMNQGLQQRHPTAMLIAEDSTNFEKVTAPVEYGGLGFDYKWDLGWMNDTLDYFKKTPEERKSNLGKLTFSMMYFWREHYILPFSHDENVHGKATILQKMYGEYEDKFPQGRALYLYMAIHPGKMLDFMGNEFGQLREYDESREQDWLLLDYPVHEAFANYRRTLNELYRKYDAFWSGEYNPDHFLWLDCDHPELDACAILRKGQEATVFAAFNFGDTELKDYELTLPGKGKITPLLNSDWNCFGGRAARPKALRSKTTTGSVKLTLAPYSAQLYRFEPAVEKETKATPHNSRLTA
jgi:1,4-alpha-glucan branching enzyme